MTWDTIGTKTKECYCCGLKAPGCKCYKSPPSREFYVLWFGDEPEDAQGCGPFLRLDEALQVAKKDTYHYRNAFIEDNRLLFLGPISHMEIIQVNYTINYKDQTRCVAS
jgi:hypothetical protein